jgi:hypothetical protein
VFGMIYSDDEVKSGFSDLSDKYEFGNMFSSEIIHAFNLCI